MAKDYEVGVIINPSLDDEQIQAVVQRLTKTITDQGGVITKVNAWGKRRLAYPIKRHIDGYYLFMDFQTDSDKIAEIERYIHVQENILRHIILFHDTKVVAYRQKREEDAKARELAQATAARESAAAAAVAATAPEPVQETAEIAETSEAETVAADSATE